MMKYKIGTAVFVKSLGEVSTITEVIGGKKIKYRIDADKGQNLWESQDFSKCPEEASNSETVTNEIIAAGTNESTLDALKEAEMITEEAYQIETLKLKLADAEAANDELFKAFKESQRELQISNEKRLEAEELLNKAENEVEQIDKNIKKIYAEKIAVEALNLRYLSIIEGLSKRT